MTSIADQALKIEEHLQKSDIKFKRISNFEYEFCNRKVSIGTGIKEIDEIIKIYHKEENFNSQRSQKALNIEKYLKSLNFKFEKISKFEYEVCYKNNVYFKINIDHHDIKNINDIIDNYNSNDLIQHFKEVPKYHL